MYHSTDMTHCCVALVASTELGSPLLSLYEGVDMVLEVSFHLYDGCFVLEAGGPVKQHLSSHLADKLRVVCSNDISNYWFVYCFQ